MTRIDRLAAGIGLLAFSVVAIADEQSSIQRRCAEKTNATYGYQCFGEAKVFPGVDLEPVTLVGTISGSDTGTFSGRGTFNSSQGSVKQRLIGPATFQDRTCFGHVKYRVFLTINGSDALELDPLDIDFATVDGGNEILGAPTAGPNVKGASVPRLTCRLVKVRGSD